MRFSPTPGAASSRWLPALMSPQSERYSRSATPRSSSQRSPSCSRACPAPKPPTPAHRSRRGSAALYRLCRVGEAAVAGLRVGQVGLDRALFLAFGEELARDACRRDHRATAALLTDLRRELAIFDL